MKHDAWNTIKRKEWFEFDMSFTCSCGQEGIFIDSDEPSTCPSCGKVYTLEVHLFVEDKKDE